MSNDITITYDNNQIGELSSSGSVRLKTAHKTMLTDVAVAASYTPVNVAITFSEDTGKYSMDMTVDDIISTAVNNNCRVTATYGDDVYYLAYAGPDRIHGNPPLTMSTVYFYRHYFDEEDEIEYVEQFRGIYLRGRTEIRHTCWINTDEASEAK